jgi:large subunit ribosomal protein L3
VSIGILGTKVGMTQIFDQAGKAVPVTVIEAGPCHITQVKTEATDGYTAVQLGYGAIKEKNLSQPEKGHLAKSSAPFVRHLHEYRLADVSAYELGGSVKADIFTEGQIVDVTGTSIGKGFAGYQKRHNFARGPMSHGSKNHRQPGSTGAGTTPGRTYPGKKMAGRLGGTQTTSKKLIVIRVDSDRNLILVKGTVPGKSGALVNIIPARLVGGK